MQEYELNASTSSTAEVLGYRQRLEKPAGGDIALMEWSPTMDLLAATFVDNSVIVNRLSWQRVWSVTAQSGTPTALAWRPDGKVLAVGRSDGSVNLLDVEDGNTLHTYMLPAPVTSLRWMTQDEACVSSDHVEYKDRSLSYLPPLPTLENSDLSDGTALSSDPIQSTSKVIDILLAGDKAGTVHVCIGGVFCATDVGISGSDDGWDESHVMVTHLSGDLNHLSAVSLTCDEDCNSTLRLQTVSVPLLHQRCWELWHLSRHYSQLCRLLKYASATLRCMHEAWEDLLLMVDAKLAQYSTTLEEGTSVSDELLILLACGRMRLELREFLLDELTAKGVKKIGLSLEMSYMRIRKYSLTCLSSVIQALQFHLSEVLGMAGWRETFGVLGISPEQLQVCLNSLGTFALKNHELQSVIDESLKSMKAFFSWLYVVILKLGDESVPPNMKQHLNAEELKLVMHFLKKRLTKASEGSSQAFNLEVVGQYLVNEDLKIIEEKSTSLLEKLLEEAKLTSEAVPWLFSPSPKKSLLQLLNSLTEDINRAFATTKKVISETFVPKTSLPLLQLQETRATKETICKLSTKTGKFVSGGRECLYFPCARDIILLISSHQPQEMKCCRFCIRDVPTLEDQEKSEEPVSLLNVRVYSTEALSLLFTYNSSERKYDVSVVAQLPVEPIINLATEVPAGHSFDCCESHDVGYLLTQVHRLDRFHATGLAVSGPRHLAAVVSHRSKKVRLFDVDAEEEDEDSHTSHTDAQNI